MNDYKEIKCPYCGFKNYSKNNFTICLFCNALIENNLKPNDENIKLVEKIISDKKEQHIDLNNISDPFIINAIGSAYEYVSDFYYKNTNYYLKDFMEGNAENKSLANYYNTLFKMFYYKAIRLAEKYANETKDDKYRALLVMLYYKIKKKELNYWLEEISNEEMKNYLKNVINIDNKSIKKIDYNDYFYMYQLARFYAKEGRIKKSLELLEKIKDVDYYRITLLIEKINSFLSSY